MSSAMTYTEFLDSTDENKVHFVSGKSHTIKGLGVVQEPTYVLETSGSAEAKVYLHNLSSIRLACEAFLDTFKMTKSDKWGLCLSTSHVAGFSILARSYFGELQEPHCFKWSKDELNSIVENNQITILSLVPTQIFDLVQMGQVPPKCLRMVFVGGAKLTAELREKALNLGWPLIECYGSTETFAQMSYSVDGKSLKPFTAWSVKIKDNEISVSGPGLFKGQLKAGVYRSRKGSWFETGDVGSFDETGLKVFGKKTGLIKIKGSYFDFNELKSRFQKTLIEEQIDPSTCFLVCLNEARDGAGVYMISSLKNTKKGIFSSFEEIKGVFYLKSVERSALGKVRASSLSDVLKKTVLSL